MRAFTPPIDLLDADFYVNGAREAYAWMRQHSPVYFDAENDLWGIATYGGVRAAEGNPAVFSNAGGSRPDTGPLPWMMDMDAPDHLKRRKLVNRAFTPARVRDSAPRIRAICDDLIDAVCERGECDFRHDLAAPLPLIVICDLLGFPPEDRAALLHWSDEMLGSLNGGPDALEAAAASFGDYMEYAHGVIADRRMKPADDLVSILVHAEVDGERLDDDELVFEMLLLLLGGDETTRNVTCGGMEQLLAHPAQKLRVAADACVAPRRRRGNAAMGLAHQEHEPHGHRGRRVRGTATPRRRQGPHAVRVCELRRSAVRRPEPVRRRARAE